MNYKGYELSQSINGTELVFLARTRAGSVVFRESSEKKLKDAIDAELEAKAKALEEATKENVAKIKKAKTRDLFQSKADHVREQKEAEKAEEELAKNAVLLSPQERVTRGPDGKFVSKGALQSEKTEKKSFWDRLK